MKSFKKALINALSLDEKRQDKVSKVHVKSGKPRLLLEDLLLWIITGKILGLEN